MEVAKDTENRKSLTVLCNSKINYHARDLLTVVVF